MLGCCECILDLLLLFFVFFYKGRREEKRVLLNAEVWSLQVFVDSLRRRLGTLMFNAMFKRPGSLA